MSILKKKMNPSADKDASVPNLGVAYNVRKKAMMAKGGRVPDSAKDESRPATSLKHQDAAMVSRNEGKMPNPQDKWTDTPVLKQARTSATLESTALAKMAKGGLIKQERSKFATPTGPFKVRDMDWAKKEEHLISEDPPASPKEQPPERDNELEASTEGPSDEALHMKKMAEGGEVDDSEESLAHHASMVSAIMAKRKMMAEGGQVELDNKEIPEAFDSQDADALLKEDYDHMDGADAPADSNEESPEHDKEDIDDKDVVSSIRRKMKAKSPITK